MKYFSQVGQDEFLFERFFRGKRDGVFVDIGAYDGVKFSNSLFFERYLGWTGLCVEPMPEIFSLLNKSRKAECRNCAVSDFSGSAEFFEMDSTGSEKMLSGLSQSMDPRNFARQEIINGSENKYDVDVVHVNDLLGEQQLFEIDFCSIDTEGSELSILRAMDLKRFRVSVFAIENNYEDPELRQVMADKGYSLYARLGHDDIFIRSDVKALPLTTVICAVWSQETDVERLLRGHQENLCNQTVPVDCVYVFDGGKNAPAWLTGKKVTVSDSLSIYEAWNHAIPGIDTPYVMNLNLDDRLHKDAVQCLEHAMQISDASLVGGDWKICFTQDETDDVGSVTTIEHIRPTMEWPPRKTGADIRLGSGGGERGTYGPATLWRMAIHRKFREYPCRFSDGTPIRLIGDLVWWNLINRDSALRAARIPYIIGNYHSRPDSQAEFRYSSDDELRRMELVGIPN